MAKAQKVQVLRNKRIYDNVSLDMERTETFGVSKWALFKTLFLGKIGTIVLANLMAMFFALPGMAVIFMFYLNSTVAVGLVPYSGNIGFGMSITVDAATIGASTAFNYLVFECLFLIPCIVFFALGVAGNMFIMNKLANNAKIHVFKDFFRGIKRGGLSACILGLMLAVVLVSVILSVDFFDVYGLHIAYKVVSLTVSIILAIFLILFISFFISQTAMAKMPLGARIRNAFLFMFGTNLRAIIFVGIAIAPLFIVFIPGIMMLYAFLFVLFGVSYPAFVIVLFARSCYEQYTVGKENEPKQPTAAPVKREEPEIPKTTENTEPRSSGAPKKKPVQYKNPKKGNRNAEREKPRSETVGADPAPPQTPDVADSGDGE